jgi:DNA-binding transcriptional MocR family regulator
VTVAHVTPKRRLRSVAELAARWQISEERALAWLEDFEERGYAERRGEFWRATAKARRLHLIDGHPV